MAMADGPALGERFATEASAGPACGRPTGDVRKSRMRRLKTAGLIWFVLGLGFPAISRLLD